MQNAIKHISDQSGFLYYRHSFNPLAHEARLNWPGLPTLPYLAGCRFSCAPLPHLQDDDVEPPQLYFNSSFRWQSALETELQLGIDVERVKTPHRKCLL